LIGCIAIAGFQHLVATIRQSTILGNARKSLNSNSLLIFQARLVIETFKHFKLH
jgi:hypothetical protein